MQWRSCQDINLLIVSRGEPPAEYARLHANPTLAVLDWNDLRLTLAETESIAGLHEAGRNADVGLLHARAGAWVAGLTLLLESGGSNAPPRG